MTVGTEPFDLTVQKIPVCKNLSTRADDEKDETENVDEGPRQCDVHETAEPLQLFLLFKSTCTIESMASLTCKRVLLQCGTATNRRKSGQALVELVVPGPSPRAKVMGERGQ